MTETARRIFGAATGAGLGTFAYWLMLQSGLHILAAVGVGLALGVSGAARTSSLGWALLTAALAVLSSLLVEYAFRPFAADPSLCYFITHIGDLPRNSLVSLVAVAVLGFYFGRGRVRRHEDPG